MVETLRAGEIIGQTAKVSARTCGPVNDARQAVSARCMALTDRSWLQGASERADTGGGDESYVKSAGRGRGAQGETKTISGPELRALRAGYQKAIAGPAKVSGSLPESTAGEAADRVRSGAIRRVR
ncbi:hypothetical protein GCM10027161_30930 [Microbispora hainanensis]